MHKHLPDKLWIIGIYTWGQKPWERAVIDAHDTQQLIETIHDLWIAGCDRIDITPIHWTPRDFKNEQLNLDI